MKAFFALLRLQLLSRYADLKPRNLKTQLKEKKGRTVGKMIAILVLIVYLGVMLFYLETKAIGLLMKMGMPEMLVTVAVMLATAGTLVMSFFFTLSALYLGRDAAYLASLPLKPRLVMSAKLSQVWLSETLIDGVILLPACILYGVRTGADALFYLRLIPVWLLIAVLPICVISFLSSLLIRLSALWKHREMLVTVGGIALLVAYMFLMMNIGSLTGDAAVGGDQMEAFFTSYSTRITAMTRFFPTAAWAAEGLLDGSAGKLILWIALSLAAPVLTVWLLGYSYRTLSLLQTETPGTGSGKKGGRVSFAGGSQLKACIRREIRTILRVPSYATNILPISFMPLLIVIMMAVAFNNAAGNKEELPMLLAGLPQTLVMLILAAAMSYMSGMNPALSTAVTREGKGHDFLTALPVSEKVLIRAKVIVGFGLSMAGVAAATVALIVMLPDLGASIWMAFALCALFTYVGAMLSLIRDVRKPKLDWVTEQEAVKQNYGVLISMLLSWALLLALAVLSYFMIRWELDTWAIFAVIACILTVLSVLLRCRLNRVTEQFYRAS